jgi:hypothetical protein
MATTQTCSQCGAHPATHRRANDSLRNEFCPDKYCASCVDRMTTEDRGAAEMAVFMMAQAMAHLAGLVPDDDLGRLVTTTLGDVRDGNIRPTFPDIDDYETRSRFMPISEPVAA